MPYRGVAIQCASSYRAVETYVPLLQEIADLGANCVLLAFPGHMEHARSQAIYIDARKVPARDDILRIIRAARDLDLQVMVMPVVLLQVPRGSEWRGVIDPPKWDKWWEEYERFVLHFADLAREGGAAALLVGSELVSTEKQPERWIELIERTRRRFPEGKLGYSANWDHYRPVKFWDRLDFIGMTSYNKLADDNVPTVADLIERWRPIRADILEWQRKIGKPIVMTEVGWCSQEGAAQYPWNYYHNQNATPGGLEEQRRLYEAFIRVWSDTPELAGVIWWEWTADPGGPSDFGYTPKNKPAEQVLRKWFRSTRPTSQPTSRPTDPH